MDEGKQDQNAATSQSAATTEPTTYGYCSWHRGYTAGIRVIEVVEQASGPGGVQSACGPCREQYGLVPYADRP
ncbi:MULTISPECIES: hypothetical protein [Streptomyces]|uniref:Uncharacterized protein n=2 Tax=Streptomyces TaxID=1883 RepID=A0ABT9LGV3_STRGD|nr:MULTISPECIES: hypothetical protein [Streptomyces]MDP9682949.1 hypothetical protein [Streptomyces griseoviridis]GGS90491.1 hypothetical protein GCM10010240_24860 [Streptomyces griseoviridis]GGU26561.1 hypothetical protein GCM10010259_16500 [Streptomyces daghestanicus]GHI32581.1 hypothetical protein Sdagh_43110 [Streptomyces daghestanicus]